MTKNMKRKVRMVAELVNSGMTLSEVASEMDMSRSTAGDYRRRAKFMGLLDDLNAATREQRAVALINNLDASMNKLCEILKCGRNYVYELALELESNGRIVRPDHLKTRHAGQWRKIDSWAPDYYVAGRTRELVFSKMRMSS